MSFPVVPDMLPLSCGNIAVHLSIRDSIWQWESALAPLNIKHFIVSSYGTIRDALELRRLRREFPRVHRRLIFSGCGVLAESDASYLDRLRKFHRDRVQDLDGRRGRSQQKRDPAVGAR